MKRPSKPVVNDDEAIERTPEDHARFAADMAAIRKSQIAKVADALDDLDSHGIYGRDALAKLEAAGIDVDRLSSQTPAQVRRAIEARGLGGSLEPGLPSKLYTGHVVSDEVLVMLGFAPEGRRFYGRGSAHRANIEQLRREAKA